MRLGFRISSLKKRLATSNQVKRLWDSKALEWDTQVGKDGDRNRILNSDPVLWKMLGTVRRKVVLDAGCGSGYLSLKLAAKGAEVVGVDHSTKMIKVALRHANEQGSSASFQVRSLEKLRGLKTDSFDLAVSSYVLQDVKGFEQAVAEVYRVLKVRGRWVCVILHPCFDHALLRLESGGVSYTWDQPYFDRHEYWEKWGSYSTPFLTYHRSVSDYWKVFRTAGFEILDFQEPVVEYGNPLTDRETVKRLRWSPFSVAFNLKKR